MKRILAFVFLIGLAQVSAAMSPRQGLWWNPSESGRGFTIEIQDNVMVVATFAYDQTGAPMWYLSSGLYDYSTSTFASDFGQEKSGQCFGCPYVKPTPLAGPFPPMKIVFDSSNSGTVYYNGGSSHIQPEYFAYQPTSPTTLKGEWIWSFQIIPGVYDTEWPVLNGDFTASTGQPFATGSVDGLAGSICVADYDVGTGAYAFLCEIGNYDHYFIGRGDDRRIFGSGWLVTKGSTITGGGSPGVAFKVLSLTEVKNLTPARNAAISDDLQQDSIFSRLHTSGQPTPEAVTTHQRLLSQLRELAHPNE